MLILPTLTAVANGRRAAELFIGIATMVTTTDLQHGIKWHLTPVVIKGIRGQRNMRRGDGHDTPASESWEGRRPMCALLVLVSS